MLQARQLPDLKAELLRLIRQVPVGHVTTYGTLARAMGCAKAARWVGEFLVEHQHNAECPCHRVVRQTGEPGLFVTRNPRDKQSLLLADGVPFVGERVDLAACRFDAFSSSQPFRQLVDYQLQLADGFTAETLNALPEQVGGIDVSYAGDEAIAAFAVVETQSGELIDSQLLHQPVPMDYIPGFLTFREGPVLLVLLQQLAAEDRLPDVLLVDGNGRLHPRRAGIATCLGVELGLRTIGVGKSLLCGRVVENAFGPASAAVFDNDELIGYRLQATDRSRPIFISAGHRMTLEDSVVVCRQLFCGHRIPEPVYHADRLSRSAKAEVLTTHQLPAPNGRGS